MEWKSVNDELPPIDERVLLFTDTGIIEGSRCKINNRWNFISLSFHGCGCCSEDNDIVTHWMPRPEPPQK